MLITLRRIAAIPFVQFIRGVVNQFWDPLWTVTGVLSSPRFASDLIRYRSMQGAESTSLTELSPQLHDRTNSTPFDAHYFYANGWAMRGIVKSRPRRHVDVASQSILPNLLAAVLPVTYVEYRPLEARIDGLTCMQGSLLELPFEDNSVESLSCLHAAEHVGLGRYGDALDPEGTRKAARELSRVLAPGGRLYFALPVGRPRLCFNAHRIHSPSIILDYFLDLQLCSFAAVGDDGSFHPLAKIEEFESSRYACGLFLFERRLG